MKKIVREKLNENEGPLYPDENKSFGRTGRILIITMINDGWDKEDIREVLHERVDEIIDEFPG